MNARGIAQTYDASIGIDKEVVMEWARATLAQGAKYDDEIAALDSEEMSDLADEITAIVLANFS